MAPQTCGRFRLGQVQGSCWRQDLESKYGSQLDLITALIGLLSYLMFQTEYHLPYYTEVANNIQLAQWMVKRLALGHGGWNQQPHQPSLEKPFDTVPQRSKAPATDILDSKAALPMRSWDVYQHSSQEGCASLRPPPRWWGVVVLTVQSSSCGYPLFLREADMLLLELSGSRCTVTDHRFPASL